MIRLTAVCLLLGGCASVPHAPRRPNVVVLMADDHSADVFGAYGNPKVRTPNLDALAARGVRFDRAYCNQPVCAPSRQSILTGLYSHTIGVTLLGTALRETWDDFIPVPQDLSHEERIDFMLRAPEKLKK